MHETVNGSQAGKSCSRSPEFREGGRRLAFALGCTPALEESSAPWIATGLVSEQLADLAAQQQERGTQPTPTVNDWFSEMGMECLI